MFRGNSAIRTPKIQLSRTAHRCVGAFKHERLQDTEIPEGKYPMYNE